LELNAESSSLQLISHVSPIASRKVVSGRDEGRTHNIEQEKKCPKMKPVIARMEPASVGAMVNVAASAVETGIIFNAASRPRLNRSSN
jgi:hypothetical protein